MAPKSTSLPKNETKWIPIAQIEDLPTANPNRMSASRFSRLKSNIEKYGFVQPILVYRKGRSKTKFVLSDGFHRRLAMLELGQTKIEAKIFSSKTGAETAGRILRIAMNHIRGEPSIDLMSSEISSLLEAGVGKVDLEDTGVDASEIEAILGCASIDVEALLTQVAPTVNGAEPTRPGEQAPRSHKLTFIFATEADKQLVMEKLEAYDGGPAESLIQALS